MAYQDAKTMMMAVTQKMKMSLYGPANISANTTPVLGVPPWMGATLETGGPVEMKNTSKLWIGTPRKHTGQ